MAGHRTYLCMKYSMVFSCAVIFLSGMLLVGLGAWMRYGAASLVDLMGHYSMQLINLSYICIAMGSIVSLTSIMGCAGACRENRCLLSMFFIIMMKWVVAQTVGVFVVMVYSRSVGFMLNDAFKDSLVKFYLGVSASDPISTAWNVVMTKFSCCGFKNMTADFVGSAFTQTTGLAYPKTCCANITSASCDGVTIVPNLIHPEGCFDKVINVIKRESTVLGAAVGSMGVIEIGSLMLSMILFMKLGSMQYEVQERKRRVRPQPSEHREP
ncbi:tetraspanin-16-like [Sardina pilchardus]|uniref:tetraspanin-16-like n=1 Tax=Sardina pilchardus TaxID=27697 RepID=UPI002E0E4E4F